MTTDSQINANRTETFKKGDKVMMHTCIEATHEEYIGKVWTCQTDSYLDKAKQDVVFLEGFSGCFASQYLRPASKGDQLGQLLREGNKAHAEMRGLFLKNKLETADLKALPEEDRKEWYRLKGITDQLTDKMHKITNGQDD